LSCLPKRYQFIINSNNTFGIHLFSKFFILDCAQFIDSDVYLVQIEPVCYKTNRNVDVSLHELKF